MRCPKCQYISFESSDRCRNCGYEFALAVDVQTLDLPIQTGDEAIGPLNDFALSDPEIRKADDLPLFRDRPTDGDVPFAAPPAAPRPPLAVRRSSPAAARATARAPIEEPQLDLDPPLVIEPAQPQPTPIEPRAEPETSVASVGSRIIAALVDGVILGAIGLAVLYLTLRICGLTIAGIGMIPPAPFASFLLLIAGGYFTLFVAANGQTIGKMATGVKVVSTDLEAPRVSLGHSVVRAAAYLVSALPAGLGLLPALFGADRRAVHDRLAATRVVKA